MSANEVSLALVAPLPAEVPVGTRLDLTVSAACAGGRDLCGGRIEVMDGDKTLASGALAEVNNGCNETRALALTAPEELGEFAWRLVFPRQDIAGITYPQSALPLSLRTVPHDTSLAVWDIPSPVLIGQRLRLKVGAKSSGECALAGATIEILDASGARLGRGTLGDTPFPQTSALYVAEIEFTAPAQDGVYSLTAQFAAAEARLPHTPATTTFTLAAVKPPAHRLTVSVVEAQSRAGVENVQIGVGPYRAATDTTGVAQIATAAGRYELAVWKPDYEADSVTIDIDKDIHVEVALTPLPPERTPWD